LLCVPEKLFFDYCKSCGAVRIGYRWVEGGELPEAVQKYVEQVLASVKPCSSDVAAFALASATPLTVPSWRTIYLVKYRIELKGVDEVVEQSYRVEVRANPTICPMCKDARGGDYNVLLQIRGAPPAVLAEKLSGLFETSSQVTGSIIDIVEKRNGVDIMLLDRGSASKILRELRKHFKVSVKVTGEDVGVTSNGRLRRRQVISASLRVKRR